MAEAAHHSSGGPRPCAADALRLLAATRTALGSLDASGESADDQIELIESLRALQSAATAAAARVSVSFAKGRVADAQARGHGLSQQKSAAVTELALAHRIGPAAMSQRLSQYRRLVAELPAYCGFSPPGRAPSGPRWRSRGPRTP